ncbi:hypothetical protein L6452_30204 [Arctium lappa]|uniref:Uncharacterized protein n=1 Tax=Arctium lappa TaxID=4217 RepID=A0ACB8ZJ50_ARCLA|nr:hypothetical protein L6452_30204 [Arctium lappa]
MAGHLPTELIVEILSRLPSKSLLRCRSVCKSWLSMISSAEFKLVHLNNFNQQNPRNLVRHFKWRENKEVYSVHFDDEALTADCDTLVEFPFHRDRQIIFYFRIIGCCNGVVCLSDDKCESREDKIILWNPSIRRNVTLIPPTFRSSDMEDLLLVFGFGYDKMYDDYKVVRLAYDDCSITRPQASVALHVEVYNVKSAIWRAVGFPHDLHCFSILPNWSQVFFDGSIHWIACDLTPGVSCCSIMTFDINTELFAEIQLPESLVQESAMSLEIAVVRESLSVIYSSRRSHSFPWSGPSTYKIWAMKEYKNPASWTMIYNMHYPTKDVGRVLRLRNNGDMITGSRYGDLMIHTDNVAYCVYASCTGFIIEDSIFIDIYQESLALLDAEPDV